MTSTRAAASATDSVVSITRVLALDGLRAVAVLAVMAGHTGAPIAAGGWLGVDIFFVLSGYLITSILLNEHDGIGRIRLGAFYLRRALRLYPALLTAVLLVVLAAWAGWIDRDQLGRHVALALLYLQDLAAVGGWADDLGPFAHTWSLAIEEHFYLIWPLVLIVVARRGRRAVLITALLGAAVCFVLMQLAPVDAAAATSSPVYYRPDARSAALLLGCALAVAPAWRPPAWLSAAALAALPLLMLAVPHLDTRLAFAAVLPATWAATGVVISAAVHTRALTTRFFSLRPMVWVGTISYGLYLYNFIVVETVVGATDLRRSFAAVVSILLTLAIAATSWRLIERPASHLRTRLTQTRRLSQPAFVVPDRRRSAM